MSVIYGYIRRRKSFKLLPLSSSMPKESFRKFSFVCELELDSYSQLYGSRIQIIDYNSGNDLSFAFLQQLYDSLL